MKWSFLLFSSLLCLQAIAQYPATGNKARLGWQTTGDGLVYRGAIGDTTTLDPSGINNAWMLLDTASGNLYAYRTKAWRLVSGGGGSVSDTLTGEVKGPLDSTYVDTVYNINFDITTDTTAGIAELKYNDTQGSLMQGLKGGNVTNIIGQQLHQRVLNKTGSPLAKGEAVFLQGSQGNRITVAKAIATVDSTSANTFGIVAESIADNQSGYIITEGLITGLNTSALTEGAAVWLSPSVAGGLTTTKPQAPDHGVYIGVCVKQNNGSGELFVKIRNGQELEELHDVRITSPASNASLYYNAAQGIWRDTGAAVLVADTAAMLTNYINVVDTAAMLTNYINVADTATMLSSYISNADTAVFARDFQISGTTNRLAMFTGSNTVGNSVVDVTSDTVSIRDYSNSYAMWRFHSNINKRGFTGYPSGTRFYSLVNASYASFMYGDRSAGVLDQQAFTQLTAHNGGGAASGYFSAATTLNGADSTLYFNISGLSANANPTFPTAQMAIQKGGNVGINTTTPTAKLHINNPSSTTPALNIVSNSNVIGSTNDAVSINMQPGQVNQNNTGVRVFNTITDTSAEGSNTGIAVSLNARNSSYGVYSAVSKNWGGSYLFGEAIGVYGSATTDSPAGFSYGGYFKNDTTQGTGFGVFVQTTTPKGSGTVTPLAIQHNSTELMRVQSSGNVGIGTASPSRPLHVAGTTAIRIPVGNFAQRGTSGAGDIRVRNDTANLEFHNGTTWQTVINNSDTSVFARDFQISGTAGQVAYFNAANAVTSDTAFRWSAANKTLGINTSTTSGANIIIKNSQEPSRSTVVATQTFDADTTNWTRGTGWTFNGTAAVATAATGNLTYTPALTITSGNAYEVTYTISGYSAGTLTAAVGNVTYALPTHNATANIVVLLPTSATGGFRFTTSTFTGNLDNISVVEISNPAPILISGQDNNSTTLYSLLTIPNSTSFAFGSGGRYLTGTGNTASGYQALFSNTTGVYNTANGFQALYSNTTGSSNTAFGAQALYFNTTGINNMANGYQALYSNTTGSSNTANGRQALASNTTGSNNIANGFQALFSNTTGSNNIANGFQALLFNTTGNNNMANGANSLRSSTTGSDNTAIGYQALRSNTTGTGNTSIGINSMYNSTAGDTLTGSNNIAIGRNAADNIRFGAAANVAIGNQVDLPTSDGSNQGVYQNVLFFTGASGTGTTIAAGSRAGIKTNAPASDFHVAGEVRIDDLKPTGTPRNIVGSSSTGDLSTMAWGNGLTVSVGDTILRADTSVLATKTYVTNNTVQTIYIPINLYAPGDTVANTTTSKAFFMVHSGLNGYCIDSYTVKAISGSGTADIQIDKNGSGANAQSISGTTVATKDTNIALATGDYIRGQVFNLSGTLVGLGLTLEIKKTCN